MVLWALTSLLLLLPFARTQSTNVTCLSSLTWMDNSRGQSPCLMAAYLMGACELDGQWMVVNLPRTNTTYEGPASDHADVCTCSSVVYSLVSACAYCQGAEIPLWNDWIANCPASIVTNGTYDHNIPSGTEIPGWTYLTVLGTLGTWDPVSAEADRIANNPTSSASGFGPSATNAPSDTVGGFSPVSTDIPSPSSGTSASTGEHSNLSAIIGGAVGGGLGFILLCILAYVLHRQHARQRKASSSAFLAPHSYVEDFSEKTSPPSSANLLIGHQSPNSPQVLNATPWKIYNPDDPSTYPDAYQQHSTNNPRPNSGYGGNVYMSPT